MNNYYRILIQLLGFPFLIIGLAWDIIKLPVLLLIMVPIWLIVDLARWARTGEFEMTLLDYKDVWYLGLSIMFELFYSDNKKGS